MKETPLSYYLSSLFCLLLTCGLADAADNLVQQRGQFQEAQQALLKNDLDTFKRLSTQLQDYPIAHYLRYAYLKAHLQEEPQAIQAFLEQYKDSPITGRLRQEWLTQLANKDDWKTFLAAYLPPSDTLLQCYYLQARLRSERVLAPAELEQAKGLWLVGYSQPSTCDPVFAYLDAQKVLTDDLCRQRIHLAIPKGNVPLTSYLAKRLPTSDQAWIKLWQGMYNDPEIALKTFKEPDAPLAREILLYGLKRLAREDADSAYSYWETYKKQYAFTAEENAELFRYLALRNAGQNPTKATATEWLAAVDKDFLNDEVYQARLQLALAKPDWQAVLKFIQSLSATDQSKEQWQYWQARALEQREHIADAEKIFTTVAEHRHYYGFLAAERLGIPYQFEFQPLTENKDIQTQLLNKTGVIRARELYLVGLTDFARGEWQAILSTLTPEELPMAGFLAHQWGWHHQAIVTLTKAQVWNDLNLRFPLPYLETVQHHTTTQGIKKLAWVYAVIRQESAFQEDARSSADALGLMQLLLTTAKEVATKYQLELPTSDALFTPDLNIQLGTAYLKNLLAKFNGNHLLATAAYNAGPSPVKRWANQYKCLPSDIWVELIPFPQTRDYVQRVMSYTIVFEKQLAAANSAANSTIKALSVTAKPLEPMPLDEIRGEGC